MKTNRPQRKNLRLPDFDYSLPGAYFITICARDRLFLIDPVPVRAMIQKWWDELPQKFENVELDEFVIMPNHLHGIILLKDTTLVRGDLSVAPKVFEAGGHTGPPVQAASIPSIVQWFKTMTTNEYIRNVKDGNWTPFPGKLWHRNYYEHIIRNDKEYKAIQYYIRENPAQWANDRDNPANPACSISSYSDDICY